MVSLLLVGASGSAVNQAVSQKKKYTIAWDPCPDWMKGHAEFQKQFFHGSIKSTSSSTPPHRAMIYDCGESHMEKGCVCGVGDRLRAATEVFKVIHTSHFYHLNVMHG